MRRTASAAAAAALAVALLAGCAPEPAPTLATPPVPEFAPPAVSEERAQEILFDVEDVVAQADEATDADLLAPRVTGAAEEMRRLQYAVKNAGDEGGEVPDLWADAALTVVTATDSWPRSILAVSAPTAGTTQRLMLALAQKAPRDPYKMVAWSVLLPGAETPTFASPDIGSAPVKGDEASLVATPTEALDWYAQLLTSSESEHADAFDEDAYRLWIAEELSGLSQAVEVAGEVSSETTPGDVVFGIGTADGGAVVFGTVETAITLRKTIDGAELTLGDELARLGGTEEVENAAVAKYKQMVSFYIPPADSDAKIQVLGAERVLAAVDRVE